MRPPFINFLTAGTAMLLTACTSDNPDCVRVDAQEFMRQHPFKGIPTDRFIGISQPVNPERNPRDSRAYKEIFEMGLFHSERILWIPTHELPPSYLERVKREPNEAKPIVQHPLPSQARP